MNFQASHLPNQTFKDLVKKTDNIVNKYAHNLKAALAQAWPTYEE